MMHRLRHPGKTALLRSLLICLFLSPRFIDFLRNREFGQNIREDGPQGHMSKAGTPTMGGIMASFAGVGDIIMAEPKALIGFAGPRVVEQTIRQKLPEGFQKSEFLLAHGLIDMIVDRRQMRTELARLLALLQNIPAEKLPKQLQQTGSSS